MSSAVQPDGSELRPAPFQPKILAQPVADAAATAHPVAERIAAALQHADAARDERQWTKAADGYRAVLDLDPQRAPIWVQYGHMLKEAGNMAGAEEAYGQALKLEPGNADTYLQLGHLLKITGRKHSAGQMYLRSLETDPTLRDAWKELCALGMKARADAIVETVAGTSKAIHYFDLSDILIHFSDNRTPTGIQRIVLAVAEAALQAQDAAEVAVCAVHSETGKWKRIDNELFLHLMQLSHDGARNSDQEWRSAVGDLFRMMASAPPLKFPEGSTIISLGSPWGLQNYFMALREAKEESSVSYVAFVHDTVPLLYPEYCEGVIPIEYVRWLHKLLSHADLVLANAENTKKDFLNAISQFGSGSVPCEFVYPNGDFTSMFQSSGSVSEEVQSILPTKYALFVGTIQPRKNHMMVLSAWRQLIKELGVNAVPTLVLAGKLGWYWEQVVEFIKKTDSLDGKLRMLNQVSDTDLQALYQNAMFTIYNSHYEGWGLPVTESLSFGKVPLIARNSALLESGGKHAVFFESSSEPSFMEAVRNMIFKPDFLVERERAIRADPPVRSWQSVAAEIRRVVKDARAKALAAGGPHFASGLKLGQVYHFGMKKIWAAEKRGGFYDAADFVDFEVGEEVRAGPHWNPPEEWGVWTCKRTFRLVFDLSAAKNGREWGPDEELRLCLSVRGHHQPTKLRFDMNGSALQAFSISPHTESVLSITFKASMLTDDKLVLTASQNSLTDLAKVTEGRDPRTIGIALKSFMVCRMSDLDARMRFLESIAGYVEGVIGVDAVASGPTINPEDSEGGFLLLGAERADIAHANR